MTAIQTKNLCVQLNGLPILRDVSFDIARGSYGSIIGPNGAGKTTLLRCLLGMYPYDGSAQIAEIECATAESRMLAQQVSYVPQTHNIEFPLSVFDFILMGRYPYLSALLSAQSKDIDAVENAMELTGTLFLRKRTLCTLSGGERQMVYIAAALAQETPVILLDEPAAFLDWNHQTRVMQLLKKINTERDITILAVHHDLNCAAHWSDQVIALKNGKILFHGSSHKLIQPKPLEQLFETTFVRKKTLCPKINN